jgi:predicted ribosome quality control (RQC) complex YloA/Tae2 family protein
MPLLKTIDFPKLSYAVDFYIGQNAADNFTTIDAAHAHHMWFHLAGQSSCHVVAAIPETMDRKELRYVVTQGALLCKQNSRCAKQQDVEIMYARISDVTKTKVVGMVTVHNQKTVRI